MNLAAIVGAAVALVDGEPILEVVWTPASDRGGLHRGVCYVRTRHGWRNLFGMPAYRGLERSRRTDPFVEWRPAPLTDDPGPVFGPSET